MCVFEPSATDHRRILLGDRESESRLAVGTDQIKVSQGLEVAAAVLLTILTDQGGHRLELTRFVELDRLVADPEAASRHSTRRLETRR